MRRSGARSFRMRWNRGDAMTTGPGARRRLPVGAGGAPAGRPAAPGQAAENGAIRVRRRGRTGREDRGRPQSVHVPFPSWIAAGGTRCIHQVRE